MRGVFITLVPMMASAALLLWGGERLSRRVVEERVPVDSTRLMDFSVAFRSELDRLDSLFGEHVAGLAGFADRGSRGTLGDACARLVGFGSCHVFGSGGENYQVPGERRAGARPPPRVELESGAPPLDPAGTVVLPGNLGTDGEAMSGWIATGEKEYRVHWTRTPQGNLLVIVLDQQELQTRLQDYLEGWIGGAGAPLRGAGERFAVSSPGDPPRDGEDPAAVVVPYRAGLGEWRILAWDRTSQRLERDAATLWGAGFLAGILVLLGVILYFERRRGVRLAEERVSFVNRVSHELGTPLTNILLNLDLAGREIGRRPEEARRRLAMVGEETRRMARLVANVLTFSRSERKALEIRRVARVPDEVIAGVLEQFQPALDRRGIEIEWRMRAGELALIDPDALSQIIGNLISNVEKYAATGGWLGMETALEGGRLRVRVADRGPGIPGGHRERIFTAFERVNHSVSEGASGTGLGLAIARDLARRVDGELSLVGAPVGAVFELDLPAPSS